MKTRLLLLVLLSVLFACKPHVNQSDVPDPNMYQDRDKEILDEILELHAEDSQTAMSDLMVKVGQHFMGTPYVSHTLEKEGDEQLIVNLREMDCTTFAENCLAISRTIQSGNLSFDQFAGELLHIRYRNGKLDKYPSRLHYFCDWIHNNQQKKLIVNQTEDLVQNSFRKEINFMSTHPDSYKQLKEDSTRIESIAAQEKLISAREMYYVPEDRVAELEGHLMDGDIVGICTNIEGIAIQHVGILIRMDERIHLLHASSKADKVVISSSTLEDFLLNSKSATGIMLARPV